VQQRHGYLPLTTPHSLRDLAYDAIGGSLPDRHWLAIRPTRDALVTDDQIRICESRGELYPPGVHWQPATVACPPVNGQPSYPALVARDYTCNTGGHLARFDRTTIDQILEELNTLRERGDAMPGEYPLLRWRDGAVEVFEDLDDGDDDHPYSFRRYDVTVADADGLYPLGAYTWPWQIVD
jgi:hypothetical protein